MNPAFNEPFLPNLLSDVREEDAQPPAPTEMTLTIDQRTRGALQQEIKRLHEAHDALLAYAHRLERDCDAGNKQVASLQCILEDMNTRVRGFKRILTAFGIEKVDQLSGPSFYEQTTDADRSRRVPVYSPIDRPLNAPPKMVPIGGSIDPSKVRVMDYDSLEWAKPLHGAVFSIGDSHLTGGCGNAITGASGRNGDAADAATVEGTTSDLALFPRRFAEALQANNRRTIAFQQSEWMRGLSDLPIPPAAPVQFNADLWGRQVAKSLLATNWMANAVKRMEKDHK